MEITVLLFLTSGLFLGRAHGDKVTVIGARAVDHDLSTLKGHRLRTHGSLHEANVPFVISEPLNSAYAKRGAAGGLRSHEIFDFAINGTA